MKLIEGTSGGTKVSVFIKKRTINAFRGGRPRQAMERKRFPIADSQDAPVFLFGPPTLPKEGEKEGIIHRNMSGIIVKSVVLARLRRLCIEIRYEKRRR